MPGDVEWKSVELQIEALVPGILVVANLHALATRKFCVDIAAQPFVPRNDLFEATLFVAFAYSVGVVTSLLSRVVLDVLSEHGPRAWVFGAFAHHELKETLDECKKNDPAFRLDRKNNEDSGEEDTKKRFTIFQRILKRIFKDVAAWNAVYRSAIRRTTRRNDVDRRRSQGRLVRNLLFPAVLLPFVFLSWKWSLGVAILALTANLFIYSYAEYVILAEAYDLGRPGPKKSPPNTPEGDEPN